MGVPTRGVGEGPKFGATEGFAPGVVEPSGTAVVDGAALGVAFFADPDEQADASNMMSNAGKT